MQPPYLLFLGDVGDQLAAKTAHGILEWRRTWCLGQLRLPGCKADLGLPELSPAEARARGARTMIVAVANSGGVLAEHWVSTIVTALEAGLDVASGLHQRLGDFPAIAAAAARCGRTLTDVRHPKQRFKTGTGVRRPGKRLLTVGTDCSCGKKYTALAIEREMRARGWKADFRATGQTGIMIAGEGVAIDAVVADFISGAVEWLTPANDPDHWDVIEGQGSLFHPAFAGVSLGLLHGAQPDALVLCHEPTRRHMRGLPQQPLPSLEDCIELNLRCARLTNPDVRLVGLSINTANLPEGEREDYLARLSAEYGLPAVDPIATGVAPIVDRLP
ncbi:N-acetyltransferase DgcN [Benzoatithermus flavus]|uniref:N-acetyltransferase DgcN n=1 Tax=Benzoatithermus flavus TaxID=3108223 RepID=A0ABU8XSZ8_9PROT